MLRSIALAFILLLATAPPVSSLGKSPPPEAARPAQSAPPAATLQNSAAALQNPAAAPVVLFQSFGDSALNFEVRAWTARFEEWAAIHSQVAVAVNAALKAAGIEIPFPQRDVTLRFPSREET